MTPAALAAGLLLLLGAAGNAGDISPSPRQTLAHDEALLRTLDLLYDGSTDTALARFHELAEEHPDDPIAAYLEALAFAWKVEQRPDRTNLDPELHARLDHVLVRTEAALRVDPNDGRARLARGGAFGVRCRVFTFRWKTREAARAAKAMRAELLLLEARDTERHDASFGLGLYDYYVDILPRLLKVLRFVAGLPGGSRERGLLEIEDARVRARFHRVEAQAQLYEIYAYYENEPDRALAEIAPLRERYPNAPLWAMKLAEHEKDRLGRYAAAAQVAREIIAAAEQGAPNFGPATEALGRLALGEALLLDLRLDEARSVLLAVKDPPGEPPALQARAHLLLGRGLEMEGERAAALVHYRAALKSGDRDLRQRAKEAIAQAIDGRRVRAVPLLARARRARESGQLRAAAAAYREALSIWPQSDEAQVRVAEDDVRHGHADRVRAVIDALAEGRSVEPPWVRPWARLLRGYVADLDGARGRAEQEYKKVLQYPLADLGLAREAAERLRSPFPPARPPEPRPPLP